MSTNKYPDVRVEKCPRGWGRGAGATADEYHLLWGTKNFSLTLLNFSCGRHFIQRDIVNITGSF